METLCQPSISLFQKHLNGTGNEGLIVDSWYVHAFRTSNKANLRDLGYAIRQQHGADLELVGSAELQKLEPALSTDFKAAVLIKGQARARAPGRLAEVLAQKAINIGVEFVQADITALSKGKDTAWQLDTSIGPLSAQKIVLAAGVWSAELLKPLGLKQPLLAERGYHVEFPHAALAINNSIMDVDAKIVASAMENGVRVAGCSEFAGIETPKDPRKKALLVNQARAMLPDLDTRDVGFWLGRRPSFPDSLPALGGIDGHAGLFAAFGHSHYGLMMAPKTGELIADIVAGVSPNIDLAPYDPLRF